MAKEITQKLYDLIPSQQTMYIMVKYSIHKQVTQIPSSITVKEKLDFDLAIERLKTYKTIEGQKYLAMIEGNTHHGGCGECNHE